MKLRVMEHINSKYTYLSLWEHERDAFHVSLQYGPLFSGINNNGKFVNDFIENLFIVKFIV